MAPKSMKGPMKRATGRRSTAVTRGSKITKDLKDMRGAKKKDKVKDMTAQVLVYMEEHESEVEAIHDAVMDGFFSGNTQEEYLHPSYIYMAKVPMWVELESLIAAGARFTASVTKAMGKVDRGIVKKLHSAMTLTDGTFHIPVHKISSFQEWAKKRSSGLANNLVKSIKWDSKFAVDWHQTGVFRLEPPLPTGGDPKAHMYEKLKFVPTGATVGIDNITGEWKLEQNWSIKMATIVAPASMRPRPRYTCRNIFPDDFSEVYDKAKDTSQGVTPADGPAQGAGRRSLSRHHSTASNASQGGGRSAGSAAGQEPLGPRSGLDQKALDKKLSSLRKAAAAASK